MNAKIRITQVSKLWYSVAIDTVPLPEKPAVYTEQMAEQAALLLSHIVTDALEVAVRTLPSSPPDNGATHGFSKHYRVAIDTVPLPEEPAKRVKLTANGFTPAIN